MFHCSDCQVSSITTSKHPAKVNEVKCLNALIHSTYFLHHFFRSNLGIPSHGRWLTTKHSRKHGNLRYHAFVFAMNMDMCVCIYIYTCYIHTICILYTYYIPRLPRKIMKYEPTHPMTQDLGTAMEREDGAALESGG